MPRTIREGQLLTFAYDAAGSNLIDLGAVTADVNTDGIFMAGPIQQWGISIETPHTVDGTYTVNLKGLVGGVILTNPITFDEVTGVDNAVFTENGLAFKRAPEGERIVLDIVVVGTPTGEPTVTVWAQIGG